MRKMKYGILILFAVLALVSVASAALPSQVTATLWHPGPVSYWDVDITSGGNADLPNANDYIGWCSDSKAGQGSGSEVFNVYSSLETLPAAIPYSNWNKLNYVLNHKGVANGATIQAVIWYYGINGEIEWGDDEPIGVVDPVVRQQLIDDADDFGGAYVPGPGDVYAVILWVPETAQPVFIAMPIPRIPVPEFPSLALPIAMMIGVVGAVQYVRARKE
jgi:hypothetical protein